MYRIGIGYDSHKFCDGKQLVIGGIKIEYGKGLKGHSDGDVLLHAIADAMLGASGLGDIGLYFPDTDEKYMDMDSSIILKEVLNKVLQEGYEVVNVDCVLIAQEPKLSSYYGKMIKRISEILEVGEACVNIKAKTNEGMGFIGRCEGIAGFAVVLLAKLTEGGC